MARLYRSVEIMKECALAKSALDFACKWMDKTACGKLMLSKEEVGAILELCSRLAMSVDLNLDAFESSAEKNEDAPEKEEKEEGKAKPVGFRIDDAAEEQIFQSATGSSCGYGI